MTENPKREDTYKDVPEKYQPLFQSAAQALEEKAPDLALDFLEKMPGIVRSLDPEKEYTRDDLLVKGMTTQAEMIVVRSIIDTRKECYTEYARKAQNFSVAPRGYDDSPESKRKIREGKWLPEENDIPPEYLEAIVDTLHKLGRSHYGFGDRKERRVHKLVDAMKSVCPDDAVACFHSIGRLAQHDPEKATRAFESIYRVDEELERIRPEYRPVVKGAFQRLVRLEVFNEDIAYAFDVLLNAPESIQKIEKRGIGLPQTADGFLIEQMQRPSEERIIQKAISPEYLPALQAKLARDY